MTKFTVNDRPVQYKMDPETPLLWALRDASNLTGTKYGCGTGDCGACMVDMDGEAIRSCLVTIAESRRPVCNDHRRPEPRSQPSCAAGIGGIGRDPMRFLHAGHRHDRAGIAQRQRQSRAMKKLMRRSPISAAAVSIRVCAMRSNRPAGSNAANPASPQRRRRA